MGAIRDALTVSIDISALPHASSLYCSISTVHLGVIEASLLGGAMRLKPSQRKQFRLVCLDYCLQYASKLRRSSIIYYNSAILSRLLTKYEASGNAKALSIIKQISPAA